MTKFCVNSTEGSAVSLKIARLMNHLCKMTIIRNHFWAMYTNLKGLGKSFIQQYIGKDYMTIQSQGRLFFQCTAVIYSLSKCYKLITDNSKNEDIKRRNPQFWHANTPLLTLYITSFGICLAKDMFYISVNRL